MSIKKTGVHSLFRLKRFQEAAMGTGNGFANIEL